MAIWEVEDDAKLTKSLVEKYADLPFGIDEAKLMELTQHEDEEPAQKVKLENSCPVNRLLTSPGEDCPR